MGEISAYHISDEGLIFRKYIYIYHITQQQISNKPMRKLANDLNRYFSKDDTQIINKHNKNAQHH